MRIVLVGDTHGLHRKLEVPNAKRTREQLKCSLYSAH